MIHRAMPTDMDDWTREHKIGAWLAGPGVLLCFTLVGTIIGLPMVVVGAWYWKKGEKQLAADAAE